VKSVKAYPHVRCLCGWWYGVYTEWDKRSNTLTVMYECTDCGAIENHKMDCRDVSPYLTLDKLTTNAGGDE